MRRVLAAVCLGLLLVPSARATGLLIPVEKKVPPLAMLNHQVQISIDDQVAITRVEQTFRNHTNTNLEATYVFPVPKGANVRKFSMWIGDKEVPGELVEAKKAREIFQNIVRQTRDPGLLEYMGNDLLRLKINPVPANSDTKIAISFTSIANAENGLVEYTYPLKTDGKATRTLEKFAVNLSLKSQHPIQNIYSPTHAITIGRPNDKQAVVGFEKEQALLDRDFQIFYTLGDKDVGVTAMTHRANPAQDGFFMFLVSPRAELSKTQQVPRDMVFVLDTSGSMRGKRMTQAQNALKYCLKNLTESDRFAVINFATTVNKYSAQLQTGNKDNVAAAAKWVDGLEATGGTAIDDALAAAMDLRTKDDTRTFTIVFFTDGQPTIGETDAEKILKNVQKRNTANTRIFTLGVGDDVNATLLDRIAEDTRALTTYVRENEDIDTRVSSLYAKISNPVLANLKMTVTGGVSISEVYPPQLPDLFHGTQLVVMGRYNGTGHAAIKLTGQVGKETKDFVYEIKFADKTNDDKNFVEDLWARRKVGYLLDQIRINGDKKELVDEVVALAKRYGIATPFTSFLLMNDGVVPVAGGGRAAKPGLPNVGFGLSPAEAPKALQGAGPGGAPAPVAEFLKKAQSKAGEGGKTRVGITAEELAAVPTGDAKGDAWLYNLQQAKERYQNYTQANKDLRGGNLAGVQTGKLGVDLSCDHNNLRNQTRLTQTAQRRVYNTNCLEVGGVWIDEAYSADKKTVTVKAMSDAYFRILDLHPEMKDVYRLGNHLVWVTPNQTALVIDANNGVETMDDAAINVLFAMKK